LGTWEYNVVEIWGTPLGAEKLNEYGVQGWELVTVIPDFRTLRGVGQKATRYYIFKRPKQSN
jgi:hypothetical protein